MTNQSTVFGNAAQAVTPHTATPAPTLRELTIDELQQVAGGLPGGNWTVPEAQNATSNDGGVTSLPGKSW